MRALIPIVVLLLALAACGESDVVMEEAVVKYDQDFYGYFGVATLDEMIAGSSVIVRARLRSVTPVGCRIPGPPLTATSPPWRSPST